MAHRLRIFGAKLVANLTRKEKIAIHQQMNNDIFPHGHTGLKVWLPD